MTFIEQLFKLVIQILVGAVQLLFDGLEWLFGASSEKNKAYTADFAPAGALLSTWNHGFRLTGTKSLTVKDSYKNALVIGGTGTGKSSVVLIPSLHRTRGSFVVHDPSGEDFSKSAGYLAKQGYEVKVLNFARPEVSCGYNPLTRARTVSDIQKVAALLVDTSMGAKAKDPFWNTQAQAAIAMLALILKTQEERYQNLYNVRHLLNQLGANHKAVDALFSRYADEALFAEYKSLVAYDPKVVQGIIATAKAALQVFSDEAVARVTSTDSLDFESFRSKPTVLFIQNSVADQRYYSAVTSLFFEQFFAYILSRFPDKAEQDVFLLVDEASSLNLPTLPLAVANVRKHRCGIMLLVQDFAQPVHHYGRYDAEAIRANCFAKMYFTGQSLETTKELEQTLGRFEFVDEQGKKVVRPLMTNDEIRKMKADQALLICGHHAPILAKLKPYYKRFNYKRYAEVPPPNVASSVDTAPVPVLELPAPASGGIKKVA